MHVLVSKLYYKATLGVIERGRDRRIEAKDKAVLGITYIDDTIKISHIMSLSSVDMSLLFLDDKNVTRKGIKLPTL